MALEAYELTTIRPMSEEDLPAVSAIEAVTFPAPWPFEALAFELGQNPFCKAFVADDGGRVAGYAFLWVIYERAHLVNIAVHPERRGLGIGEALLLHVLRRARREGAEWIHLEVRADNTAAIGLYEKHGFVAVGRYPRYYSDGSDALNMERELGLGEMKPLEPGAF
jgi:ribosomal-protein-alanine N-acetyltransferase